MQKLIVMFRQMFQAWSDDYVPSMGAALAYYTMFSLAPLLLIAIAIVGLVFGEEAARGEIAAKLQSLSGLAGGGDAMGLLLGTNLFDRRRVHVGLHQYVWLPTVNRRNRLHVTTK